MSSSRFPPLSVLLSSVVGLGACSPRARPPETSPEPSRVVSAFFDEVRSGRAPGRAHQWMAPRVRAHQTNAELERTVERTPDDYAAHVREMQSAYGDFHVEIAEMLAQGDRVYVRWRQRGSHRGPIDGWSPTGRPLVEVASAVYRVQDAKIVEYWIQIDREGLRRQLEANADAERSTPRDR